MRRLALGVLVAAVIAGAIVLVAARDDGRGARPPARTPSAGRSGLPAGVALGRTNAREPVDFSLVLRMPGERALGRFAAAVQDPGSPLYRHFLGAAAIGRRYGLPAARLRRLTRQLAAAGIRVTASFPQRTELRVRGAARSVERLLNLRLGDFRDPHGRRYHRPLSEPAIPVAMRDALVLATGLDTRRIDLRAAVPARGLSPSVASHAYDIEPLHKMGLHGEGQTVAVFSTDTFQEADIAAFDQQNGIVGAPPVQRVTVGGNVPFQAGDNADEVSLDLEIIRGIAPKAQIIDYETPCCQPSSFSPVIDRVVADGKAELLNMSYGYCELLLNAAPLREADRSFAVAAAHGVTIFVSSGDDGAYECQRYNVKDHRPTVPWPGSSPNVVSVGGTLLDVRRDGSYLGEVGWENVLTRAGGGGGVSAVFGRPGWQKGVAGLDNSSTTSPPSRQIPDVAATADTDSGFDIISQGGHKQLGGTSAAAPLWTGATVLIRQLAEREHAGRLGFLAPLFYRIASTQQPYPPFHDIILGGNRLYHATPGWDYSTGLGTPDFHNLARDVLATLKSHH
jgi:kumamolisin